MTIKGDNVFESAKAWARARMAPTTWERLSQSSTSAGSSLMNGRRSAEGWIAFWNERLPSSPRRRLDLWRLLSGTLIILLPALLLAAAGTQGLTIPCIFLLIAIGLSSYLSDWIGGIISMVVSMFLLPVLFIGDRFRIANKRLATEDNAALVAFALASALLIAVIEHLKDERSAAKLEAAAMRAANTALNTVEIVAAGRHAGDVQAYFGVLQSLLAAMVRVNRASAGALYLLDDNDASLIRAATYGELDEGDSFPDSNTLQDGEGFAGRVARERRPTVIYDIRDDPDTFDVEETNSHVRSVAGVPLIGPNDKVIGIAWVGLYVPYRFSATAVARLQALCLRTVAFMESARLADAQEIKLDRAEDSERRLQSVIQTMPEAVMVVRAPSGMLETSNAAAQRMFGLRSERQQRSTKVTQLRVTGDDDQEMPIVRAMSDGSVVTGVELTVTLPDGSRIPVVASAAPLYDDDGAVDVVVGVFQDVRPLKEAERLRDEFLSVVSHELRSPLTPIRGFAQIIERDLTREGGHDNHVAWLNTMQVQADRMTRLVDDLLDVSRLRSGRLRIRPTDVDLVTICRGVVDSRQAGAHDRVIEFSSDRESVHASLDGDRIFQVVDNLVGNALKYTDKGSIGVTLSTFEEARTVQITIADEGAGIPLGEQEDLFTPFYRARSAAESAVPGLGLGLYICRELVKAHNGTISVGDVPEGGTRFTIVLPL